MVTHIVLFRFEEAADAAEARRQLLELAGQIPGMTKLEVGLDFTRSARSFELGLITRHESRAALEAYQVHPEHVRVATFIRSKIAGSAAVDFEE